MPDASLHSLTTKGKVSELLPLRRNPTTLAARILEPSPPESHNPQSSPLKKARSRTFVEATEHTLQKGFVKHDLHLLLCEDKIWNNWVYIMDQYARGGLPNTKGEITTPTIGDQKKRVARLKDGQIQQAPDTVTLGPTLFRCIAGLEHDEVHTLQEALMSKSILLKKANNTKEKIDMEEMARNMKTDRVLKKAIIDFFFDLTMERLTWEETWKKFGIQEYEYNQLKSLTQGFVKDCLNRTKKNPTLPRSATTLLSHLYRLVSGIGSNVEAIPWTIKAVGMDTEKIKLFCEQKHVPLRLAILDVRGFKEELSADIFSSFTHSLHTLNSQTEFILICFVDFINICYLLEGVRLQSTMVHYEIGTVVKQSPNSWTTGVATYAIVVLFISKIDHFETIDKILGEKVCISASSDDKDDPIDKKFIKQLIAGFCPEHSYVLDIFSGGIVLEQSLLLKRRCISLCNDDLEAISQETRCSKLLESDFALQEWCGITTVPVRQGVQLHDAKRNDSDDIEVDDQPCGKEDEEEMNEDSNSRECNEKNIGSQDNNEEMDLDGAQSNDHNVGYGT